MTATPPSPAREQVRPTVPKLIELAEKVVYGDVWERPGLSKRDRSLITVATLVALGREKQLVGHLGRALDNGSQQGRAGRGHHPSCFLRRLARGDDRRPGREGRVRPALAARRQIGALVVARF